MKRFKRLKDGWIHDNELNLDWGPSSDNWMSLKDAEEYCVKQGGRLPTLKELHSLIDYSKYDPAANKKVFKDVKSSWYWSGMRTAWNAGAVWCVGFGRGSVSILGEDVDNYVRPVRDWNGLAEEGEGR